MSDKTSLKKTLYLFNQESNILLRSNWEESPMPIKRYLDRIEAEAVIKNYLENCVEYHLPLGFNAEEEVRLVSSDYGISFGPFSTIPEEESAQIYLILTELVKQEIDGRSIAFCHYGDGSSKYADKYKGFLDSVARRLISNIECYLSLLGIEMGLDNTDSVTNNFNGPINNSQLNQSTGNSTLNGVFANDCALDEIKTMLDRLLEVANAEIESTETLEDIRDNIEMLRAEITCSNPKRGVIKSVLNFLKGVNGGVQFTSAVTQIVGYLNDCGITLPQ